MKHFLVGLIFGFLCCPNVQPENIKEEKNSDNNVFYYSLPTSGDSICIAWVLDSEARGESLRGGRAVLDVVLSRMHLRHKSACEVVRERGQFSGYTRKTKIRVTEKMLTRAEEIYNMEPVFRSDCEYFHNTSVNPNWKGMAFCAKIGKHKFYRRKYV